ncbi:MAG: hypothetical protein NZU74_10570 [Chloroflexaceae bacterium]|nr:hypothetical protein [Chloroflexaceae bacterium]
MADDDVLIDASGRLYYRDWQGRYVPYFGFMGHKRDLDFWGEPNIKHGFFGPEQARDLWGSPIHSVDGQLLYRRRRDSPTAFSIGACGASGSDDATDSNHVPVPPRYRASGSDDAIANVVVFMFFLAICLTGNVTVGGYVLFIGSVLLLCYKIWTGRE